MKNFLGNATTIEGINNSNGEYVEGTICKAGLQEAILAILTAIMSVFILLKEIYQMLNVPTFWYYIRRLENIGQLLLILTVVVTTYPIFFGVFQNTMYLYAWQYETAAVIYLCKNIINYKALINTY